MKKSEEMMPTKKSTDSGTLNIASYFRGKTIY